MAKLSRKTHSETGPAGSLGKLLLQLSEYVASGLFPFVAKSAEWRRNVNLPSLGDGTSPERPSRRERSPPRNWVSGHR
jgi:hypothetical protein